MATNNSWRSWEIFIIRLFFQELKNKYTWENGFITQRMLRSALWTVAFWNLQICENFMKTYFNLNLCSMLLDDLGHERDYGVFASERAVLFLQEQAQTATQNSGKLNIKIESTKYRINKNRTLLNLPFSMASLICCGKFCTVVSFEVSTHVSSSFGFCRGDAEIEIFLSSENE